LEPPKAEAAELVPDDVILYPMQKVAKRLKEKVVA
jgi:hypothetical protein